MAGMLLRNRPAFKVMNRNAAGATAVPSSGVGLGLAFNVVTAPVVVPFLYFWKAAADTAPNVYSIYNSAGSAVVSNVNFQTNAARIAASPVGSWVACPTAADGNGATIPVGTGYMAVFLYNYGGSGSPGSYPTPVTGQFGSNIVQGNVTVPSGSPGRSSTSSGSVPTTTSANWYGIDLSVAGSQQTLLGSPVARLTAGTW